MRGKSIIVLLFSVLFLLGACQSAEEKTDSYYYLALQKIESGEKEDAVLLFEKGIKNSSPYVSKLCSLFLSEINKKKAVEIIESALKKDPEDNALNCRYMAVLYETGKYETLIDFSEQKKDLLGKDNEYIKYRLLALAKTGNDSFATEFINWFSEPKFTTYHREFLEDWYKDSSYTEYKYYNEEPYKKLGKVISVRQYVNIGNYTKAYNEFRSAAEDNDELISLLCDCSVNTLSDVGKAFVYGSSDKVSDAQLFSKAGTQAESNDKKFMLFFYAGRMLDKSGASYRNTALENLRTAFSLATDVNTRDNALWYYLETARHISVEKAVTALNELGSSWADPEYFDDFLDNLCKDLLYSKNYDLFCKIFERNGPFFSKASFTKYAYITARLVEEELALPPAGAKQFYVDSLLAEAWETSKDNVYYRILLVDKLKKTEQEFYSDEAVTLEQKNTDEEKAASALLEYKLYSHFYTYYKNNFKAISDDASIKLISEIKQAEKDNKDKYADVLRLASTGLSDSEYRYRKDIQKSLFPRFFEDKITEKSNTYKVPEYFIYSLIRSESYFDDDVYSSAGAIGLCQLMEETASDVARKLKVDEYDLLDADTNMTFGVYYLRELTGRLDENSMLAFLSYNCGIKRVRNWREEFTVLPDDLFLEVIPIDETRGYGKKILTAACLYGNLYYDKPFSEILDELFYRIPQE